MLICSSEEEKRAIAPLLGKLYVSPNSSEGKLRDLYHEVSVAVNQNLLSDATSRNALYKIHVSLGKIVNQLAEQQETGGRPSTSRALSVAVDENESTVMRDKTAAVTVNPPVQDQDQGNTASRDNARVDEDSDRPLDEDSLVDDLLSEAEA